MAQDSSSSTSSGNLTMQRSSSAEPAAEVGDGNKGDFAELQERVVQLGTTVTQLALGGAEAVRAQVSDAAAAAQAKVSEQAASAQDAVVTLEQDLEKRIRNNPWSAVAIAAGIGFLLAKMS